MSSVGESGGSDRVWWPQDLRWGCAFVAVFMAAMAGLGVWMAVEAGRDGDVAVYVAGLGFAVMLAGCSVNYASVAGFRHLRSSRRITTCHDKRFGPGIAIPTGRHRWPLVVCLAACAVFGLVLCVAALLRRGSPPDSLVPNDGFQALWLGGCGVIGLLAAVLVVGFGDDTVLAVHRDGVRRRIRRRKLFAGSAVDVFLPWEQIAEFEADELVVGTTLEVRNPVIRIHTQSPRPSSERLPYDTDEQTTVMAYFLAAEPNALMNLLIFLADNPDRRDILERCDARALLRPAPLRERFRTARRMRREARAARRNAPIKRDTVVPARRTGPL